MEMVSETADAQREEIGERRAAAIKDLRDAEQVYASQTLPRIDSENCAARSRVELAQRELVAAGEQLNATEAKDALLVQTFHQERARAHQWLKATAPQCIAVWIADLTEDLKISGIRQNNALVMYQTPLVANLGKRGSRLRELLEEAAELQLTCVDESQALARIQTSRASLQLFN